MINVLFIGNCQTSAVRQLVNLNNEIYRHSYVPVYNKVIDPCLKSWINNSDIIVSQPIFDDDSDASLVQIIKHKRPDTILILFPSCYMQFYYPDMDYLFIEDVKIISPSEYHYNSVVDAYRAGLTITDCIDKIIDNMYWLGAARLNEIFNNDIMQLNIRKMRALEIIGDTNNVHIIDITDFILAHYRTDLLFFTVNHPTNVLLEYISEQVCRIMQIDFARNLAREMIDDIQGILYTCLNQITLFDVRHKTFKLLDKACIKDIVQAYYECYDQLNMR